MKSMTYLLGILLVGLAAGAVRADGTNTNTVANFKIKVAGTTIGEMNVELYNQEKPATVKNFLRYVQTGKYANSMLHRCVNNFVVQGGGYAVANPSSPDPFSTYVAIGTFPAVTNEFLVGPRRSNLYGTIAMAKTSDPNSATSQWFINLADNTELDNTNKSGGFTVFGQVVWQRNYQDANTNLLGLFATKSLWSGIVSMGVPPFTEVPVNYLGVTTPTYRDLYTVEISAPDAPDAVPPVITIDQPSQNQKLTVSNLTAIGTAADNVGVVRVEYRVNGGAWVVGAGTTSWTAALSVPPGTSTIDVRSVDVVGNISDLVSRTVKYDTNTVQGTFNGLFYQTNGLTHESSGAFTMALSANRSYTATLQLAGLSYKLKGQLAADMKGTNSLVAGGTTVRVEWDVDSGSSSGSVSGLVTDGNWTSPLQGYRVVFSTTNPTPLNGTYTVLFPGTVNSALAPGGTGFGTATLSSAGLVTLKGTLADGVAISQAIGISAQGLWPFYVPLFKGQGSILGWMAFTNLTSSDVSGAVTWFKKSTAGGKTYLGGFTNTLAAQGAKYTVTSPSLAFTNGFLILTGGGVPGSTNWITLGPGDKVTNNTTNSFSVKVTGSKGSLSGWYTVPGTKTKLSFTGLLQQKGVYGAGYFLNGPQSGNVYFGP